MMFPITFKLFVTLYLFQNKSLATYTKEIYISITLRQNAEQIWIKLLHGLIQKILDAYLSLNIRNLEMNAESL